MTTQERRIALYGAYINELQPHKDLPALTPVQILGEYARCSLAANTEWRDIYGSSSDEMPIGFIIVGYPPNCHPDAEIYIQEAYISPESRHCGYMSRVIAEVLGRDTSSVCLYILHKNHSAHKFWHELFTKLGYAPFESELGPAFDDYGKLYWFRKDQQAEGGSL